jgi:hypothetical protein
MITLAPDDKISSQIITLAPDHNISSQMITLAPVDNISSQMITFRYAMFHLQIMLSYGTKFYHQG